jgi:hypothetical protein
MTSVRNSAKTAAGNAGFLANLVFSSDVAPSKANIIKRSPRRVMLDSIHEQIEIAKAALSGETYTNIRHRVIKNTDGARAKIETKVVPRRMFWKADDGRWLVGLRYGGRIPVELSPGKPSIVAGASLKEVIAVLEVVRDAVNAGEADEAIDMAASKAKRKTGAA